jgi:hypothetical protein
VAGWGTRAIAGVVTVGAAALVNIATSLLTQHWSTGWWAFLAVFVLVGGLSQAWLTFQDAGGSQSVRSTKVGGSVRQKLAQPGRQSTRGSEITEDLEQEQGP